MKEFHPEQLKKLSDTLSKVDLNVDNFELWMTAMSAIEQMEQIQSQILSHGAFIPHEKKFFFFDLLKQMSFFEILHFNKQH